MTLHRNLTGLLIAHYTQFQFIERAKKTLLFKHDSDNKLSAGTFGRKMDKIFEFVDHCKGKVQHSS